MGNIPSATAENSQQQHAGFKNLELNAALILALMNSGCMNFRLVLFSSFLVMVSPCGPTGVG